MFLKCQLCEYIFIGSNSLVELHIIYDYIQSFDLDVKVDFIAGEFWRIDYAQKQSDILTPMTIKRYKDTTEIIYCLLDDAVLHNGTYDFTEFINGLRNDLQAKRSLRTFLN